MMRPAGEETVKADGSARWMSVTGTKLQLVPHPENRGGYAGLLLVLDGSKDRTVAPTGPDVEGDGHGFSMVELAGGTAGDRWSLHVGAALDERHSGLKRDVGGNAQVRRAPGRLLVDCAFSTASTWPEGGGYFSERMYLSSKEPGKLLPSSDVDFAETLWDVREFSGIRLVFMANGNLSNDETVTTLGLKVELMVDNQQKDLGIPYATLQCGASNQLTGAAMVTQRIGRIESGALVELVDDTLFVSTERASFCRIFFTKAHGERLMPADGVMKKVSPTRPEDAYWARLTLEGL